MGWDVKQTREHVRRIYGADQLALVRPCLRSLADRQIYAQIHFRDARAKAESYVQTHLQQSSLLEIVADEQAWDDFNIVIREIGAHLTACVQSIHAIPDILAHAVYYSLAYNLSPTFLNPRSITVGSVVKLLRANQGLAELADLLEELARGGAFPHLSALANLAKHRSIVFPALEEDSSAARDNTHSVVFPEFQREGSTYPKVFAEEFLALEHHRCSKLLVESGITLNALLQQR